MSRRRIFAGTGRPEPEPAEGIASNGLERESVWDYPRPPRVEAEPRRVEVRLGGVEIASSEAALRALETSHPPAIYIPPADIAPEALEPAHGTSFCEWKGTARYFDVVAGEARERRVGWAYPAPTVGFEALADHVSFYPGRLECTLGGEPVSAQPGNFYGGWLTAEIVGPVKGPPGSELW